MDIEEKNKEKDEKVPNESGKLLVETYLRIFDPETNEEILRKHD